MQAMLTNNIFHVFIIHSFVLIITSLIKIIGHLLYPSIPHTLHLHSFLQFFNSIHSTILPNKPIIINFVLQPSQVLAPGPPTPSPFQFAHTTTPLLCSPHSQFNVPKWPMWNVTAIKQHSWSCVMVCSVANYVMFYLIIEIVFTISVWYL